ncbi:MAG: hypothetical protein HOP16_18730 [Acidobacteria bacterium]|nr:hypothetical protein [Acidobacteriota bacterium]
MSTFARRMIGAALLDTRVYEEVEADRRGNGQAVVVVLLASLAAGIGLWEVGAQAQDPQALASRVIGALVGWMAWAAQTYLVGTRLLPEPQTNADLGELLRTIAFAASPGLLRVFGVLPLVGWPIYATTSVWMLVTMIVAVRQALDYRSTYRAVMVCAVGWVLSIAIAAVIGNLFVRNVS